jgi:hypothetical protein
MKALALAAVLLAGLGASSLACTDAAIGISARVVASCAMKTAGGQIVLERSCAQRLVVANGAEIVERSVGERPDCAISLATEGTHTRCGTLVTRTRHSIEIDF